MELIADRDNKYKTGCILSGSIKFSDTFELFSGMYSTEVKDIDLNACGLYFISDKHEFFVMKSKKDSFYRVFEYSAVIHQKYIC